MSRYGELLRAELLDTLRADAEFRRDIAALLAGELTGAADVTLDTDQFAAKHQLNPGTVARMARAGRIPAARKVGREWRFPAGDVDVLPIRSGCKPTAVRLGRATAKRSTGNVPAVEAILDAAHSKRAA